MQAKTLMHSDMQNAVLPMTAYDIRQISDMNGDLQRCEIEPITITRYGVLPNCEIATISGYDAFGSRFQSSVEMYYRTLEDAQLAIAEVMQEVKDNPSFVQLVSQRSKLIEVLNTILGCPELQAGVQLNASSSAAIVKAHALLGELQ